tara:strand:- start:1049 stop:1984 length:936 start_codon:yes stop_codon:yes gene_type:complete
MRVYRFTLLQSYFSIINKNKKKALLLINIGIFFTIFAVSSAMISFFIEKKISDNQNELLALQIEVKESSSMLASLEMLVNNFDLLISNEEVIRSEKQFLSETKLGNKIFSENDFFSPYIYFLGNALKDIERSFKIDASGDSFSIVDMFDINSEINQGLLAMINVNWDDDEIKKFTDTIIAAKEEYDEIKKIDFENYNLTNIPSLKDITIEILNYKSKHINKPNSKIADDYDSATYFQFALYDYMKQMIKLVKGLNATNETDIANLNKNILSLSKKEKNIILLTFIFQFMVFIIIQVFEVNSINYHSKKKKI